MMHGLLTTREAAKIAGYGEHTLRRYARRDVNPFPLRRIGKYRLYVTPKALVEWMERERKGKERGRVSEKT